MVGHRQAYENSSAMEGSPPVDADAAAEPMLFTAQMRRAMTEYERKRRSTPTGTAPVTRSEATVSGAAAVGLRLEDVKLYIRTVHARQAR